jgi:hypothetical protein
MASIIPTTKVCELEAQLIIPTKVCELETQLIAANAEATANIKLLIRVNSEQTEMFIERLRAVHADNIDLKKSIMLEQERTYEKDKLISQLMAELMAKLELPAFD